MKTKDGIEVRISQMHIEPGYGGLIEGITEPDFCINSHISYLTRKLGPNSYVHIILPIEKSNIFHSFFEWQTNTNNFSFLPPYRCLYTLFSNFIKDDKWDSGTILKILTYGDLQDNNFIIADNKKIEDIVAELDWKILSEGYGP